MHLIEVNAHPSISLGIYHQSKLRQNFSHLSVLGNGNFNLMSHQLCIILSRKTYKLQRPLDYKNGTQNEPSAVLTELKRGVVGPITSRRRKNFAIFLHRRCEIGQKYQILMGHRNQCFLNKRRESFQEGNASTIITF